MSLQLLFFSSSLTFFLIAYTIMSIKLLIAMPYIYCEQKREREAIAANERRRRRMAQKLAELEEDDEDINDRRKRKNGRVSV